MDKDGIFEVFVCNVHDHLLCANIQSRHISSICYRLWIKYNPVNVVSWYCQCKVGYRVVGTCSHVTTLIWYLGIWRFTDNFFYQNRDWSRYLKDAQDIPMPLVVDESENEQSILCEEE